MVREALLAMLLCLVLAKQGVNGASSWNYRDKGPDTWGQNFSVCNGQSQSPINIVTSSVEFDNNLPIVNRNIFYTPPTSMNVSNNGHTIVVEFLEGAYTITDSALLPFPARVAQYHFHWGSYSGGSLSNGSEHTVDGRQYFGEFHVVHYNTKYPNIGAAINQSDGLAVFGWFLDVTYPQTNLDIENLLNLANISAKANDDDGAITSPFSVETLIPADLGEYYRYKGSLTTPTCDESVVWTVFKQPIEITRAQAIALASSFYETTTNETVLINNFRPPQPLNGRRVTKPRPLVQSGSSVPKPQFFVGYLALAIALICLKQ